MAKKQIITSDAPAFTPVTPRMLAQEFHLTPQRVRKVLRKVSATVAADRVKNDSWKFTTPEQADRARAALTAYVTSRTAPEAE